MKFSLSTILDTLPKDKIGWNGERHSARDQHGPCGGKQALLHVLNYCDMAGIRGFHQDTFLWVCKIGRTTSCGLCQAAFLFVRSPTRHHSVEPRVRSCLSLGVGSLIESNFVTSAQQKVVRYTELVQAITSTKPYKCHLHIVQIGSFGMIHMDSLALVNLS